MSNSIVIKEPKKAVETIKQPKSTQDLGLKAIENTLQSNNQLLKQNTQLMGEMAKVMSTSMQNSQRRDVELSALRERLIELRTGANENISRTRTETTSSTNGSRSQSSEKKSYGVGDPISGVANHVDNQLGSGNVSTVLAGSMLGISPVFLKMLGIDKLATGIASGVWNAGKSALSKTAGLLASPFSGSSQSKVSGTTSSVDEFTKNEKLYKKLDTIINLLGASEDNTDEDGKPKGKGLFSKVIGAIGAGLGFVAKNLKSLILGGLAAYGATQLYKHWEKMKKDVEENGWIGAFKIWGEEIKEWFLNTKLGQGLSSYIEGWKVDIEEKGIWGAVRNRAEKVWNNFKTNTTFGRLIFGEEEYEDPEWVKNFIGFRKRISNAAKKAWDWFKETIPGKVFVGGIEEAIDLCKSIFGNDKENTKDQQETKNRWVGFIQSASKLWESFKTTGLYKAYIAIGDGLAAEVKNLFNGKTIEDFSTVLGGFWNDFKSTGVGKFILSVCEWGNKKIEDIKSDGFFELVAEKGLFTTVFSMVTDGISDMVESIVYPIVTFFERVKHAARAVGKAISEFDIMHPNDSFDRIKNAWSTAWEESGKVYDKSKVDAAEIVHDTFKTQSSSESIKYDDIFGGRTEKDYKTHLLGLSTKELYDEKQRLESLNIKGSETWVKEILFDTLKNVNTKFYNRPLDEQTEAETNGKYTAVFIGKKGGESSYRIVPMDTASDVSGNRSNYVNDSKSNEQLEFDQKQNQANEAICKISDINDEKSIAGMMKIIVDNVYARNSQTFIGNNSNFTPIVTFQPTMVPNGQ